MPEPARHVVRAGHLRKGEPARLRPRWRLECRRMRTARRFLRVTNHYDGQKFFTREQGLLVATPMFLVLLLVEFTDLVFAVDSIPAIFAVTTDPFLVYTSNVFAILGLRSMYFLLAGIVHKFVYLKYGLSAILTFVGAKMLIADFYHVFRSKNPCCRTEK